MAVKDIQLTQIRIRAEFARGEAQKEFLARVKELYPAAKQITVKKGSTPSLVTILDHQNTVSGVGASLYVHNLKSDKKYWISVDSLGGE